MEFATAGPTAAAAGALDRVGAAVGARVSAATERGCTARPGWAVDASERGLVVTLDAPAAVGGAGSFNPVNMLSGALLACGVNTNELRRTEADRISGNEMACGVRGTAVGATTKTVAVIAAIPALNKGLAVRSISLLCLIRSDPDVSVRGAHA
jgi:hypothetical protein